MASGSGSYTDSPPPQVPGVERGATPHSALSGLARGAGYGG